MCALSSIQGARRYNTRWFAFGGGVGSGVVRPDEIERVPTLGDIEKLRPERRKGSSSRNDHRHEKGYTIESNNPV